MTEKDRRIKDLNLTIVSLRMSIESTRERAAHRLWLLTSRVVTPSEEEKLAERRRQYNAVARMKARRREIDALVAEVEALERSADLESELGL